MAVRRVDDTTPPPPPQAPAPEVSPPEAPTERAAPITEVTRTEGQVPIAQAMRAGTQEESRGAPRSIGARNVSATPTPVSTEELEQRLERAAANLGDYERGYVSTLALAARGRPERLEPMIRTIESSEFRALSPDERIDLLGTLNISQGDRRRIQNVPREAQLYASEEYRRLDQFQQGYVRGIMATALADAAKIDQLRGLISAQSFRDISLTLQTRALAVFAGIIEGPADQLSRVRVITEIQADPSFRRLDEGVRGYAETLLSHAQIANDPRRFAELRAAFTSPALPQMSAEAQRHEVQRFRIGGP